MRHIKPGRGPSAMSAVGSIVAIIFGIFWTFTVAATPFGVRNPMVFFGILFIILGVVQFIYHMKNTTGKKRMSLYDITDDEEENHPKRKAVQTDHMEGAEVEVHFCPYCGKKLKHGYTFCPSCGRPLK
ncbi:zinc ribbon domain-containing protein [Fusibacter paucivorans]|uniref:Zinc ribbon domain-containing protein n=1 Tax=Fusibacter paucivorans TaxID=76009 RepID=A0ABS5PL85_9FIRM|nr:zinc ribbon domain-containing protein [Fusibacter paucivorans]MBS7525939.1 zinc ribbon domain-containing protein [Fusibacter paucivorans]